MAAVAVVSLALPAATLAVWGWHAAVRQTLLAYVVVLGAFQIAAEMIFSELFFPDLVVLTGMVFTDYRAGKCMGHVDGLSR